MVVRPIRFVNMRCTISHTNRC